MRKKILPLKFHSSTGINSYNIKLNTLIPSSDSFNDYSFSFLNIKKKMIKNFVDWDCEDYGKLFTYNLNYFDFLLQKHINKTIALELINDYISNLKNRKNGFEPYPISLRGINWIKFISVYSIKDQKIDDSLFSQYIYLSKQIEYHLLGNHLLENSFSLLYGAYYFHNIKFYKIAKKIIKRELKEQILRDGAHFELSPMYHQIILHRILDCFNLVYNSSWQGKELLPLFNTTAKNMLSWLHNITFLDGSIPMVNDTTLDVVPKTIDLMKYAFDLGITGNNLSLNDSGYRKINNENWELFIDIGNIGPDYIPGHAHSDTFNYLLHINENPYIVDVGVSTYEENERRHYERSTEAHNTVKINGINQSDVWASFRVANRAKIIYLEENENSISATHDGYKGIGVFHTRSFSYNKNEIVILDEVNSKNADICQSFIHLNPGILPILKNNEINTELGKISIIGANKVCLEKYERSNGFNKTENGFVIISTFTNKLETRIVL